MSSTLSLIDLAGSERVKKTNSTYLSSNLEIFDLKKLNL